MCVSVLYGHLVSGLPPLSSAYFSVSFSPIYYLHFCLLCLLCQITCTLNWILFICSQGIWWDLLMLCCSSSTTFCGQCSANLICHRVVLSFTQLTELFFQRSFCCWLLLFLFDRPTDDWPAAPSNNLIYTRWNALQPSPFSFIHSLRSFFCICRQKKAKLAFFCCCLVHFTNFRGLFSKVLWFHFLVELFLLAAKI